MIQKNKRYIIVASDKNYQYKNNEQQSSDIARCQFVI